MKFTQKTDQYALGLLALEMLRGKPPVVVKSLDDLQKKKEYFADTARLSQYLQRRSPVLKTVLVRMLSPRPEDRFESMGDIVKELDTAVNPLEENRRLAKRSYERLTPKRDKLFRDFYKILLDGREDLRAMFREDFEETNHFDKLNRAILYLLNFRQEDGLFEPTILSEIRDKHDNFGLAPKDYDHFEKSLLAALKKSDARSHEIQEAWRSSIAPGLDYMKHVKN